MQPIRMIFDGLNDRQRFAVTQTEGPIELIAGAGSGKTGVLTRRVAYLLKCGLASPESIVTVTFTTKAAAEIRARLGEMVESHVDALNIGTFHSLCLRILKADASGLGYQPEKLRVFDPHDTQRALKRAIADSKLDDKRWGVDVVAQAISQAKNAMRSPQTFVTVAHDFYQTKMAQVYAAYQHILKAENAVDFDDLLMLALRLLRDNSDVRRHYQDLFAYILIDEFQDTSPIQYDVLKLLAGERQQLTVVGSPSQAIYGWRGAHAERILKQFEGDFPTTQIIVLDQNYRNSRNILRAANAIISGLNVREKDMWTANAPGEPIVYCPAPTEFDEARVVASDIRRRLGSGECRADECAILVRARSLLHAVEQALVREGLPYTLEDTKFFSRREIRDLLAYLRLAHEPLENAAALERIINTPPRKLGPKAQEVIRKGEHQLGYEGVLRTLAAEDLDLSIREPLEAFNELIANRLYPAAGELRLPDLLDFILEQTGYRGWIESLADSQERLANIEELRLITLRHREGPSPRESLLDFLNEVALMSDSDPFHGESEGGVKVLTVHAAKGLEWRVVFVVGMEDGVFPHALSMQTRAELNEERRLFYVAITRAREQLYLLNARARGSAKGGRARTNPPSRFLREIPRELVQHG